MFFSKHVYKYNLNVRIELWPNPGLVQALFVKPALEFKYRYQIDCELNCDFVFNCNIYIRFIKKIF